MRQSKQRTAILSVLRAKRAHYSAAQVYDLVREEIPDISLGTVYRNLGQLVESGEVIAIETDERFVLYDGFPEPHAHFVCCECRDVYDFPCNVKHRHQDGFLIQSERTVYYGVCKNCLKKEKEIRT